MGYYIKIHKKNGKSRFQLWYNGKQEMGYSKEYKSQEMCKKGLEEFKNWIIDNEIKSECQYLKLKNNNGKYIYQFMDKDGQIIYTSREIENKKSCEDSMKSTCRNIIHAEIKKED